MQEKGSQIDLSLQEYLDLNILNIWDRSDELILNLLKVMRKEKAEMTKNCFSYKKFFDKVLLNRKSSVF